MLEKWSARDIEYVQLIAQNVISLNTPINVNENGDAEYELGEILEDTESISPEEQTILNDRSEIITKVMKSTLSQREYDIIRCRFGFEPNSERTLNDIGRKYNLSRERIRQIEAKALRKLRQAFYRKKYSWENL